jgi:DNA-binding transcriptional ArsR family regulator
MSADLLRLVDGFRVTQTIYAGVELGIPDLLAEGERTADDLADASGADPPTLYRLLRALASLGIVHEGDERRFSLTDLGRPLRSDVPGSLRGWVRLQGRDYLWRSWGNLANAVREGQNSFRMVHGADIWEWRAEHADESAIFDEAMRSMTIGANASILDAYDFGQFGTIVDVAGGNGTLIAALLAAHPASRGILFDQEHVVSGAEPILRAAGVLDRCEIVAGSFFESVPEGADAYVLKWIIHDWEDEESVAILRTCRAAMGTDAVVLLIERDLGRPNEDPVAKLADLNMLVMPGGRERTLDEYAALFGAADLRLVAAHPTTSGYLVIEAGIQ